MKAHIAITLFTLTATLQLAAETFLGNSDTAGPILIADGETLIIASNHAPTSATNITPRIIGALRITDAANQTHYTGLFRDDISVAFQGPASLEVVDTSLLVFQRALSENAVTVFLQSDTSHEITLTANQRLRLYAHTVALDRATTSSFYTPEFRFRQSSDAEWVAFILNNSVYEFTGPLQMQVAFEPPSQATLEPTDAVSFSYVVTNADEPAPASSVTSQNTIQASATETTLIVDQSNDMEIWEPVMSQAVTGDGSVVFYRLRVEP